MGARASEYGFCMSGLMRGKESRAILDRVSKIFVIIRVFSNTCHKYEYL